MRTLLVLALLTSTAAADRRGNMGRRLEGAIGVRFGSYLVNNVSTGSNVGRHVDGGLRHDRWFVYGEYGLMSIDVPLGELDGPEQRMRNTLHLYPMSKLRHALPVPRPTFGQMVGIAWLAWMFDRRDVQ